MERTGSFPLPAVLLLVLLGVRGARADTFQGKRTIRFGSAPGGGQGVCGGNRGALSVGIQVSSWKISSSSSTLPVGSVRRFWKLSGPQNILQSLFPLPVRFVSQKQPSKNRQVGTDRDLPVLVTFPSSSAELWIRTRTGFIP